MEQTSLGEPEIDLTRPRRNKYISTSPALGGFGGSFILAPPGHRRHKKKKASPTTSRSAVFLQRQRGRIRPSPHSYIVAGSWTKEGVYSKSIEKDQRAAAEHTNSDVENSELQGRNEQEKSTSDVGNRDTATHANTRQEVMVSMVFAFAQNG